MVQVMLERPDHVINTVRIDNETPPLVIPIDEEIEEEIEEVEEEITVPLNFIEGEKYCLYTNNDDQLHIANSWSHKSLKRFYSDEDGSVYWCLMNKCRFTLANEFGEMISHSEMTEDLFEDISFETIRWIVNTILDHINFLVERLLTTKKER